MFRVIVNFTLISVALGGRIQWDGRIVGGEETTIEEYPYQVSVLFIYRHICGGSIINQNTVITAAHCTQGRRPFTLQVRAGTTYKDNNRIPGILYNVEKIIQHPDFSMQTVDCDISILKLRQSIEFSDTIKSIPIQDSDVDVPINQPIIVTGWGSTKEGTHSVEILRKVILNTITTEDCKASYGSMITDHMFCARSPGKDACQGDSGGPVAYNGQLVGIVSWGIGCARPDYPGVFAKISSLKPWIDANINA